MTIKSHIIQQDCISLLLSEFIEVLQQRRLNYMTRGLKVTLRNWNKSLSRFQYISTLCWGLLPSRKCPIFSSRFSII